MLKPYAVRVIYQTYVAYSEYSYFYIIKFLHKSFFKKEGCLGWASLKPDLKI